jgi:protocatechuate 3,4-dioxygenase beta subunit
LNKEQEPTKATSTVPAEPPKGIIRGNVKYPWGTVKDAKVVLGEKTVLSDNTGNYEFTTLNPGSYNIAAQAPFPGYEAPSQTVEVKAGETQVVDFYLDFKKAVVEGHVYGQDGKPINGATLSGVLSGKDMDSVTTDAGGYFRFSKVTPGDRFIRVNAPGFLGEARDFKAAESQPTTLEFRLTPATCKISGTVTDAEGKPLTAEMLLLKGGIVVQKTTSKAETGYYEFPAVPGRYEILPMIPGYNPKGWSGQVTEDIKADFNLMPIAETEEERRRWREERG